MGAPLTGNVSTAPLSSSSPVSPLPNLRAFEEAARQKTDGVIELDGDRLQVLATGATPTQRSVAWVRPQGGADTTSAFVAALGQSFSGGITQAVARELDLAPAAGVPLASRTVSLAIDMARTGRQAMDGVDFLTRLDFSAANRGAGFEAACRNAGMQPSGLGAAQRTHIDAALDSRFAGAAEAGQSPVSAGTAAGWLCQILAELPKD
ncbi:hypothetical protein SAMN05216567_111148 [Variovorax sp. OK605]|nr:hypothetical protein SAMN05216567_111148 [Variovorax sp. OK605]